MKVDADHIEMSRIELMGGLYMGLFDGKKHVVIPGDVIEATIVGAAKKSKEGKSSEIFLFQ
jgi:hypothetical protein